NVKLVMIRSELLCDCSSKWRLVVSLVREANREGFNAVATLLLHKGDHARAVDTSRQESAEWHIGYHAPLHRVREQRVKLVEDSLARSYRIGAPDTRSCHRVPINTLVRRACIRTVDRDREH